MPNWCSNRLTVTGSPKELARFREMAKEKFVIRFKKEEVEEKINNFLSADHYKDNIKEYLRVKKMSTEEILRKELNLIKDEHGNWGGKPSKLSFKSLVPPPKELEHTVSPMRILSEEEYKQQEERIKKGEMTETEKSFGGYSRGLTKKLSEKYKKKFGADNWYDWNCNNWGTKWDVDVQNVEETETSLCYEFDTAWSPPTTWLEKVCEMFPTLEFEMDYEEPGCAFQGRAVGIDGGLNDETWDYQPDEEEYEEDN